MPADTAAVAERFAAALQQAEQSGDVGPLADLFAADAELATLAKPDPVRGPDAARQFWTDYLKAFDGVRSEFTHTAAGGSTALLEWTSAGTRPNGHPFQYRGASVLEVDGDRVTKFRTYYDTAAFVTPVGTSHAAEAEAPDPAAAADAGRPVSGGPRAAVANDQPAPERGAANGVGGRPDGSPKPGEAGQAGG